MAPSVIVLMSAFNGEKYIKEQIDSILAQEGVRVTLLIRDDGSADQTPDILREYEKTFANVHYLNPGEKKNLGFSGSYYALMREGLAYDPKALLFAFADQDDVWLPDKLRSALALIKNRLERSGKSIRKNPLYYYSNKIWTNERLEAVHEDDMVYCRENYFDMFMMPPVYGCTTVFNRELAKRTLAKMPPQDLLYDVYMYRMACTMDSILAADKRAHILYRRHGENASGEAMQFSPLRHFKRLLLKKENYNGMRHYIEAIYALHREEMMEEQRTLCELIIGYKKSLKKRLRLLAWPRAYERGPKASLMWMGRVLLSAV